MIKIGTSFPYNGRIYIPVLLRMYGILGTLHTLALPKMYALPDVIVWLPMLFVLLAIMLLPLYCEFLVLNVAQLACLPVGLNLCTPEDILVETIRLDKSCTHILLCGREYYGEDSRRSNIKNSIFCFLYLLSKTFYSAIEPLRRYWSLASHGQQQFIGLCNILLVRRWFFVQGIFIFIKYFHHPHISDNVII